MNQIVGKKDNGSSFLALVLEPGNLHKLRQGKPILVRIEDSFPDGIPSRLELALFHSETPVRDAQELRKMAEVTIDERTPVQESKRPHCPECRSTIETLGLQRNESPIAIVFCATCGCVLSTVPKAATEKV